jgi:hypothetical protein
MKRKWLYILLFLFLAACGSRDSIKDKPAEVLPPDKMVKVLVDCHIVEASLVKENQGGKDMNTSTNQRYKAIFQKYDIDKKTLDESFDYYSKHLKEYDEIYKQVVEELNQTQSLIISK